MCPIWCERWKFTEERKDLKLQEIKVVEDQKHGQNDIDNHTCQNYNVEHF
ncbi:hypothetical protein W02_15000 [Nitrospira sp. KM1]|nr:hypothetical protein W02_15000 [Nitrospira sp. KM1]